MSPSAEPREPRYPFAGRVRVTVPFAPWRLVISARAQNVSTSGVSAVLLPSKAQGREELLSEGDPFDLQLEHEAGDERGLPMPTVAARLARKQKTAAGLELAFAFERPSADLLAFVHDLSSAGAP